MGGGGERNRKSWPPLSSLGLGPLGAMPLPKASRVMTMERDM